MGNQQNNPEIVTQRYVITQESSGLEKTTEEQSCRLYKSLRFFSSKDNYFLLDKLFFFDQSDAFEGIEALQGIVAKNYSYYRSRLKGLEGNNVLYSRLSEQDFSLRRQFLKSTLEDKLDPIVFIAEEEKIWILTQILWNVQLLHSRGLTHSNIKPTNVLITSDNHVFLADFSFFKPHFFVNQELDKIALCHPNLDEQCYLSPERFKESGKTEIVDFQSISPENLEILKKSDVFAVGRDN
jgi:serine/threonine protein kinase